MDEGHTFMERPRRAWLELPPGTMVGPYRIERLLGRGSMGRVYLVEHSALKRRYALKLLAPEWSGDIGIRRRFMEEGRRLASLDHPNIVRVHNAGEDGDRSFLVMDLLNEDLGRWITKQAAESPGRPLAEVREILEQLLEALAYAHAKGVVHRDLKPSNMLLSSGAEGTAAFTLKVADFGLAVLVGGDEMRSGDAPVDASSHPNDDETILEGREEPAATTDQLVGTIDFMAPEIRAGGTATVRSDLYSAGVTAYLLLTGKKPLGKYEPPSRLVPDVPPSWNFWIDGLLAADPEKRTPNADVALQALRALSGGVRGSAQDRVPVSGIWDGGVLGASASMTVGERRNAGDPVGTEPDNSDDAETKPELPASGEVRAVLNDLRRRLLDLTLRNPLLHFTHGTSKRYLRLLDEVPALVAESLMDGKAMTFRPLTEPGKSLRAGRGQGADPLALAAELGFTADWELPRNTRTGARRRHRARTLQTPYLAEELESKLANITKLNRTAVEETGVNMLYLVFGFLEWFAPEEPDKPLHAPLFFVPVRLEKGRLQKSTRTYEYELITTGEDLPVNDSLAARLLQDFRYEIPLTARRGGGQSGTGPETMFKRVERSVRVRFPHWRVRRFGTLAFLNFSNLIMHHDLDPGKWTGRARIDTMPLVQGVVSGYLSAKDSESPAASFRAVPPRSPSSPSSQQGGLPCVESADGSQVRAVADALRLGRLVIEGPPGTGKSQTITNLIACALHRGKTVLFISEKMAALDVVRTRLDRVGLGRYCLELHSSSTRKLNVVESIAKRMNGKRTRQRTVGPDCERQWMETARRLDDYADMVNDQWAETGWTVYQILTGCARLRMELPKELHAVETEPLVSWDNEPTADERRSIVRALVAYHEKVSQVRARYGGAAVAEAHPWRGVGRVEDGAEARTLVCSALSAWIDALENVSGHLRGLESKCGDARFEGHLSSLGELPEVLRQVVQGGEGVQWEAMPWAVTDEGRGKLCGMVAEFGRLRSVAESPDAPLDLTALLTLEAESGARVVGDALADGLRPDLRLADAARLHDRMREAMSFLSDTSEHLREFGEVYGVTLPDELRESSLSPDAVRWLRELVRLLQDLPESVATRIDPGCLDEEGFAILETLRSEADALEAVEIELAENLVLTNLPSAQALQVLADDLTGGWALLRWFRPGFWEAWRRWRAIRVPGRSRTSLDCIADRLRRAAGFVERRSAFAASWRETPHLSGESGHSAAEDALAVRKAMEWYCWMRDRNSRREGALFGKRTLSERGQWLNSLPGETLRRLRALESVRFDERAEAFAATLTAAAHAVADESGEAFSQVPLPGGADSPFQRLFSVCQRVAALCGAEGWKGSWALDRVLRRAEELAVAAREFSEWLDTLASLGRHGCSFAEDSAAAEHAHTMADSLRATLGAVDVLRYLGRAHPCVVRLCGAPGADTLSGMVAWAEQLEEKLGQASRAEAAFFEAAAADTVVWRANCPKLSDLLARNRSALSATALFGEYQSLLCGRERLRGQGFASLPERLWRYTFSRDEVRAAAFLAFCMLHARRILSARPELRQFEAAMHDELRRDFAAADAGVLGANARRVQGNLQKRGRSAPEGQRGTRVGDLTETALLKHEINKQRRHIPIRHLLQRAGKAVQALMPCFMMSPKSVAQYLGRDGLRFDLLVIDEASQMKPAEAMGAVARCGGMVVVGDPRQMPPTSFFDRASFDSEDEDGGSFAYAGAESVLDAVMPVFPVRRLLWHYRSRDPALIAFSNRHFYDGDLLLFPAPFRASKNHGLRFHKVDAGVSSGGANPAEAEAVARRVGEILRHDPRASVGVAAMSLRQRDLIDRCIENHAKEDAGVEQALVENRNTAEELFVKNLESVQGDERDIILISCTYGPETPGGPVPLRFGPVLAADGWRRLNVLFTRSRVRMEVFASMEASDIRPKSAASRGVHAFRDFLAYARDGEAASAPDASPPRPPEDDFQRAVVSFLAEHGYACDCRVGVSGCRVDVAVRDPADPSRYLLGIDSDGPDYRAVGATRDRDFLKHRILSLLGWEMHSVWAPEFHRDPAAALAPVLERLGRFGISELG